MINVEKFASDLYENVNRVKPDAFKIQEMDLQGVHPKTDKFMWRGAGMPQITVENPKTAAQTDGFRDIRVNTQSFRTFKITYNQEVKKQKLTQSSQHNVLKPKVKQTIHMERLTGLI